MSTLKKGAKRSYKITAVALLLLPAALCIQSAQAATLGSLYSYSFTGGTGTIANGAAVNSNVALTLQGNWSSQGVGVLFEGDRVSKQSVGYAKPASGATLSVPATKAIGASIMIRYKAPVGAQCFSDSPNITQIGKFGANVTQVKLQLSNCGKSSTSVFPQCRVAGNKTPTSVLPVTGSESLVDGEVYVIQCVKTPDPASGNAVIELKTMKVDASQPTVNTFSVAPTGVLNSSQYLSVANKYPLPSQANNTDQFNGEVAKLAYCTGESLLAAQVCLEAEMALPPPPAP